MLEYKLRLGSTERLSKETVRRLLSAVHVGRVALYMSSRIEWKPMSSRAILSRAHCSNTRPFVSRPAVLSSVGRAVSAVCAWRGSTLLRTSQLFWSNELDRALARPSLSNTLPLNHQSSGVERIAPSALRVGVCYARQPRGSVEHTVSGTMSSHISLKYSASLTERRSGHLERHRLLMWVLVA